MIFFFKINQKNFDGFTLIPLANILSIKEYSYGEIILDKGQ